MRPDLFVGITSWNSSLFLPHCLRAIARSTPGLRLRVMVADNASSDASAAIARAHGAEVIVARTSQADALNLLLSRSDAPRTLLLHADVILLDVRWFEICSARLGERVKLVSPEDIGCGPCTRPFGRGQPESSFLLLDTEAARRCRRVFWRRRWRLPWPRRLLDLYGEHVTHNLPRVLAANGYTWHAMDVHPSPRRAMPLYRPAFPAPMWTEALAWLRYGLGNFYSLDGVMTHYHNWYERRSLDVPDDSTATIDRDGGVPTAYVKAYTHAFLADLESGTVVLPSLDAPCREPRSL